MPSERKREETPFPFMDEGTQIYTSRNHGVVFRI
jgi:hypothetical protein